MNLFKGLLFALGIFLSACTTRTSVPLDSLSFVPYQMFAATVEVTTGTVLSGSRFTGNVLTYQDDVYILSVAHGVVGSAGSVEQIEDITLPYEINGTKAYKCTLVKCGPFPGGFDLSLYKVVGLTSRQVLQSTKLRSKNPKLGQELQTIGNPSVDVNSTVNDLTWMYSKVIVSRENILIPINDVSKFCITAPVYAGQSGSGVFDNSGIMVGIIEGTLGGNYGVCIGVEEIIAWSSGTEIEPIIAGSILH